jgi:hypothetical protein
MATDVKTRMDVEARMKRIVKRSGISKLVIYYSGYGVAISAMPDSFHPLVEARRKEAYAAAGPSLSIVDATAINDASMGPVARGHASDLEGALTSLEADMKKLVR